jgi:2,4-diketo-3-deoxy-L-fuconate hydrolase
MRLISYRTPTGEAAGGVVRPDGTVAALGDLGHRDVLALIEAGPGAWAAAAAAASASSGGPHVDALDLLAPVPRPPRNMICVGVNYRSHFDEGKRPEGTTVPDAPVLFSKPWTCLTGHGATVEIDRHATDRVDWEAEIAVVIGIGGRNIDPANALDHVFGYTLANDLSARDLQLANGQFGQWFKGKGLDGFCPMGPTVVTADEVGDYRDLHVTLRVNGVTKQDFHAVDMINDVARVIARCSLGMTLLPGDVILTGTAAGVGHWCEPPEFLHGGDVVEIECPGLGLLRTTMAEPGGAS